MRSEALALKEVVAELTLENRSLKEHDRGWGERRMLSDNGSSCVAGDLAEYLDAKRPETRGN